LLRCPDHGRAVRRFLARQFEIALSFLGESVADIFHVFDPAIHRRLLRLDLLFIFADLCPERIRQGLALVELLLGVQFQLLLVGFFQSRLGLLHVLLDFGQGAIACRIDVLLIGIGRQQGKRAAAFLGRLLLRLFLAHQFSLPACLLFFGQRGLDLLDDEAAVVALFVGAPLACVRQEVAADLAAGGVVTAINADLGAGIDGQQG
jgi:hypothetical protein